MRGQASELYLGMLDSNSRDEGSRTTSGHTHTARSWPTRGFCPCSSREAELLCRENYSTWGAAPARNCAHWRPLASTLGVSRARPCSRHSTTSTFRSCTGRLLSGTPVAHESSAARSLDTPPYSARSGAPLTWYSPRMSSSPDVSGRAMDRSPRPSLVYRAAGSCARCASFFALAGALPSTTSIRARTMPRRGHGPDRRSRDGPGSTPGSTSTSSKRTIRQRSVRLPSCWDGRAPGGCPRR